MVSYGRHQITGIIYRGAQFPSESYTEGGRLNDPEGFIEEPIGGPYEPPPPECYPYECSALSQAQSSGLVTVDAVGSGMWDLLDYQDNPSQIPEHFRTAGGGSGWNLTCTNSLLSWTTSNIKSSVITPASGDMDVCNMETAPRCCSNINSGSNASWHVDGMTAWGSHLPNVSMAVVSRGMGASAGNYKSRLFIGYVKFGHYTSSAYTSNGQFEVNCWGGRKSGNLYDVLVFNWATGGDWQKTFDLPLGLLTSSTPVLVEISMSFGAPTYPATSFQGYTYASYDMMSVMTVAYRVTKKDGTVYEGSYSVDERIAQVFDHTHSNGNTRPIADAYIPRSLPATFTNNYLMGTYSGLYNLAIAHEVDGATGVKMQGGNAGAIDSSLSVAFTRNFSDYELPEYCEV